MFCPKCGNNIEQGTKFCPKCGSNLEMPNNVIQDKLDEAMIKAYIGEKNQEKIFKNLLNMTYAISIPAVFLGFIYYAYRKMYLTTLIIFGVFLLLFTVLPYAVDLSYFVGFAFYPLYRIDITRKLRKIKKENVNQPEEDLISKAKESGGTNIVAAIIVSVIYITYIVVRLYEVIK